MEIQEAVSAVRRTIASVVARVAPLGSAVEMMSETIGNSLMLLCRHVTQSKIGLVVSLAAAKIVLQRLAAVARGERWSFAREVFSGIFAGLGFVAGAASAACLAWSLGSNRAKLGGPKGVAGVALLYFIVIHVVGRRLTRSRFQPELHNSEGRGVVAQESQLLTKVATDSVSNSRAKSAQQPPEPPEQPEPPQQPGRAVATVADSTVKVQKPAEERPQNSARTNTDPSVKSRDPAQALKPATPVSNPTAGSAGPVGQEEAQQLLQQAEQPKFKAERLLTPPPSPSEGGTAKRRAVPETTPPSSPKTEKTPGTENSPSSPGTPWQMVDKTDQQPKAAQQQPGEAEDQSASAPVELFVDPTVEELHANGAWLVGRRVNVEGYGPGTVVAFQKTYGRGASRHVIKFDKDGQEGTVKLARKSNTDPEKKPWKVASPPRTVVAGGQS